MRPRSTSARISAESFWNRSVSARCSPYSKMAACPSQPRSVVDSPGPAAERRPGSRHADPAAVNSRTGGEMPPLVELAVIRQIGFRHHAQYLAAVDHHGGVIELAMGSQRGADDQHRKQLLRSLDQLPDP